MGTQLSSAEQQVVNRPTKSVCILRQEGHGTRPESASVSEQAEVTCRLHDVGEMDLVVKPHPSESFPSRNVPSREMGGGLQG